MKIFWSLDYPGSVSKNKPDRNPTADLTAGFELLLFSHIFNEPMEQTMTEPGNPNAGEKGAAEKLWQTTRKTFQTATFKANQYKRIVQKKIDLGSLHKKISLTYTELGMLIDDLRGSEQKDLLAREEVQVLLQKLDSFKHVAATLEEEIEAIRAEGECPAEGFGEPESGSKEDRAD
jgi:hypothetical protein